MLHRLQALRHRPTLLLMAPLGLYFAALNPYFIPDVYDNVTYFFSARSIADHGEFSFQGEPVRRWPPVFPCLLAILQWVGLRSLIFSKLLVIASVGISLALMHKLWVAEQRPRPILVCTLTACLPWSLLTGSTLLSEWPCMALSFGFLLVVRRLNGGGHPWRDALLAGVLLGLSGLTRWVAVLLGVTLVAQIVQKLIARRGLKSIGPELLAGTLGAALIGAWLVLHVQAANRIPGFDAGMGQDVIDVVGPVEGQRVAWYYEMPTAVRASDRLTNLLFFQSKPLSYLDLDGHTIGLLAMLPVLLMLLGVAARVRHRRIVPSDFYALATLGLFSYFALHQMRYFVPIAPFLIHYLGAGVNALGELLASRRVEQYAVKTVKVGLGAWYVWLVALSCVLLVTGNARTFSGLSPLASPSPEAFYRGHWRDLYLVSQEVAADPSLAPVSVLGHPGAVRYVLAFSGQPSRHYPPMGDEGSLLHVDPAPLPAEVSQRLGLTQVAHSGVMTLYRITNRTPLK